MDYPMLRRLTELVEAGREAVLCTVVDEQGSTDSRGLTQKEVSKRIGVSERHSVDRKSVV